MCAPLFNRLVSVGNYTLTAITTDALGTTITSAPVTVTAIANVPPAVSLTSPAANAVSVAPGSFTLTADAADADGTIAKEDFYAIDNATNASTLIGTATQAPYTGNWSNVLLGDYTLSAVATDTLGAVTTSSQVNVTVNTGIVQAYYIHTDHLDTPRIITDTSGNVVWQWDNTDPFGANMADENPSNQGIFAFNLGFPGQYRDNETNTFYNFYRDAYDSEIGRYTQSDPIGLAGGINTFIYVLGNPLSYIDPLGLANSGWVPPRSKPKPEPTTRPDGLPWGAGCGDKGTDCYVPDSVGGGDFRQACMHHDNCFATPGASYETCNKRLGQDMALACSLGNGNGFCSVAAQSYPPAIRAAHTIMDLIGVETPFEAAQREGALTPTLRP